jgi:phasin
MATAPKKSVSPSAAAQPEPIPALAAELQEVSEAASRPVEELQRNVRSALEKGVVDSRAAFAKAKASADEAASAIEVSFTAAKDGALAINAKAFEALRVAADANFDYLKASLAAKSFSDLVALQSEFARKQMETMTAQAKDIGALAQKTMTETAQPIRAQVAKSFTIAV